VSGGCSFEEEEQEEDGNKGGRVGGAMTGMSLENAVCTFNFQVLKGGERVESESDGTADVDKKKRKEKRFLSGNFGN
jgi:hypothetical protein